MAKKQAKKSTKKKPMPPWLAKKMGKDKETKGAAKPKAKGNPFAKKGKEEKLTESTGIVEFINAISSKNYAQANKYLQGVIEDKLQQRISASLNEPLF